MLTRLLNQLLPVARDAAAAILHYYQQLQLTYQSKSDNSPLTQADLASHDIITKALRRLTPDIPIISEESTEHPCLIDQQQYWLIDPLDGTRAFIADSSEFTINIALINKQQPVFAILVVPALQTYYFAIEGKGAFKQTNTESAQRLSTRADDKPAQLLISRYHQRARLTETLQHLSQSNLYQVRHVSSAYKFALIAEGQAALHFRYGTTSLWDSAAGQCLVEQAGGHVCTWQNQPLRYNASKTLLNSGFIVAANEKHAQYLLKAHNQTENKC